MERTLRNQCRQYCVWHHRVITRYQYYGKKHFPQFAKGRFCCDEKGKEKQSYTEQIYHLVSQTANSHNSQPTERKDEKETEEVPSAKSAMPITQKILKDNHDIPRLPSYGLPNPLEFSNASFNFSLNFLLLEYSGNSNLPKHVRLVGNRSVSSPLRTI
jgi:hypothetical protein